MSQMDLTRVGESNWKTHLYFNLLRRNPLLTLRSFNLRGFDSLIVILTPQPGETMNRVKIPATSFKDSLLRRGLVMKFLSQEINNVFKAKGIFRRDLAKCFMRFKHRLGLRLLPLLRGSRHKGLLKGLQSAGLSPLASISNTRSKPSPERSWWLRLPQ
jgi:hypothetical protein